MEKAYSTLVTKTLYSTLVRLQIYIICWKAYEYSIIYYIDLLSQAFLLYLIYYIIQSCSIVNYQLYYDGRNLLWIGTFDVRKIYNKNMKLRYRNIGVYSQNIRMIFLRELQFGKSATKVYGES